MSSPSVLEQELLDVARELGPEVIHALTELAKSALNGAGEDELKRQAEKAAVLAAFKASYRRGNRP